MGRAPSGTRQLIETNGDPAVLLPFGERECYTPSRSSARRRPMTEPTPMRLSGPTCVNTRLTCVPKALISASAGRSDKLR
jgi:hypothetical protein